MLCTLVQAWQPLKGPVSDSPLALCDAATVAPEDLIPATLHFPDRVGQTYVAAYNPNQRYAFQTVSVIGM